MEHIVVEPWWLALAEAAVAAASALIGAAVLALLPLLRQWLRQKSMLNGVLADEVLWRKMDEGAVNIIRAVEAEAKSGLRERHAPGSPISSPGTITPPPSIPYAQVVEMAKPVLEREFAETIKHFDKTPQAVQEFLMARVGQALGKK